MVNFSHNAARVMEVRPVKKLYKNKVTLIALIIAILFVISLLPILSVSFYNHPTADDLGFSAGVHQAAKRGGNLFEILKAAASMTAHEYSSWQGTHAAIFIFALQPGALSENLYFLTTFILLGALIFSTVFLIQTIVVRWLGQKKSHMLLISLVTLFLQIQFVPDIASAFFWFNGASFYTLFYSFAQVLAALLIRIYVTDKKKSRIILTVFSVLLAIIVGGGNYTTGLFCACTMGTALFISVVHKRPESKNLAIVFFAFLLSFLISTSAPGNAVRAQFFQQVEPFRAVGMSLSRATELLLQYISASQIIAIVFIMPLIYTAAQKCAWTFKYPIFAIILAFGLFACQLTPLIYATGGLGEGRQQDIYYYSSILMVLFDLFYLSGWVGRKYPNVISSEALKSIFCNHATAILLSFAVLFFIGCRSYHIPNMTSIACLEVKLNGTGKWYDEIVSDNIAKMEATTGVCYVRNVEFVPKVFRDLDISNDKSYWINSSYARYYDCEGVIGLK